MSKDCRCATCRYWDAHSIALRKGDCRVPGNHRYSRVSFAAEMNGGKPMVALLDSFGGEETGPNFVCGAWKRGGDALA